jgi:hypothetical protein
MREREFMDFLEYDTVAGKNDFSPCNEYME